MVDLAQAFDNAKNDDFFFLPPDALNTPDFKVGMDFFMTADGKGARIIVYHQGEAMSPEGIKQIQNVATAAQQSLKGTPLSNAKLSLAGASSNYRDIQDFSYNDLIIMMLATFGLVFPDRLGHHQGAHWLDHRSHHRGALFCRKPRISDLRLGDPPRHNNCTG